ncbi:non-ribosomal peptide synthetase [Pseudoalteromonas sp. OANN1]|uniref:non-ribosomal peptide synthetase n=1 Tax=Pseudoalteromonas sp. OANN1 TaxID=2954497 RepID=UPI00209737A3|nr:non-ribosomal peptide synthetase [Pseudoalteromonas sp. OANN1]MCO7199087.1 amino acid adenylation domain-containing protein [Pseudoalteromonas sp. OANN1]
MSISLLIRKAADSGIFLYAEEGQLKFKATVPTFPEELKGQIQDQKQAIIDFLSEQESNTNNSVEIAKIERNAESFPLSFAQQRFWFMEQLEGSSAHYNMPISIKVTGKFDTDIAQRALEQLVNQNEILRTTYHWVDEVAMQRIHHNVVPKFTHYCLKQDSDDQQAEIKGLITKETQASFDLSNDVMIRGAWIQIDECKDNVEGVLILTVHHIAGDEGSTKLLTEQFTQLYAQIALGETTSANKSEIQYLDYAIWQREQFTGATLKKELDHWKRYLDRIPELHSIPTDYPRPSTQSFRGKTVVTHLDSEWVNRLTNACRSQHLTPYIYLETAYSLILAQYGGSDEVVVGSPFDLRDSEQLSSVMGCFINSILIRNQFDQNDTFDQLLQKNRVNILKCFSHAQVPYDMVVSELGHSRSMAYSPVNQLRFSFIDQTQSQEEGHNSLGLKLEPISGEVVDAKFDLVLVATLSNHSLRFVWSYNTDIFSEQTISILASAFNALLKSVLRNGQQKLSNIDVVTAEQKQLLADWSQGPKTDSQPLLPRLQKRLQEGGDCTALYFENNTMSYAELNSRVNCLANYLQLKNTIQVALHLERGFDSVIAILACLKASITYIPIDTNSPLKKIQAIIEISKVNTLLCHTIHLTRLKTCQTEVLALDSQEIQTALENVGTAEPQSKSNPKQLAYVIYTSGSTGIPKGVAVYNYNLDNFYSVFEAQLQSLGLDSDNGWLWNASYAFDASLKAIVALCRGHHLVLATETQAQDPRELVSLLRNFDVEVLNVPPLMMELTVPILRQTKLPKHLIVSGDVVSHDLWHTMRDYLVEFNRKGINAYGPTETTVNATYGMIEGEQPHIGSPVHNCQAWVLNESLHHVPPGAIGELYLSGDNIAAGYLNDTERTGQSFISCPWLPETVLYRSGDIVRYMSQGQLQFIGRADDQLKIRGFRIELGEVQQAVNNAAGVTMAAIVCVGTGAEKTLHAYIQPEEQTEESSLRESLVSQLSEVLPHYALPSKWVFIKAMPYTTGGKIDRQKLVTLQDTSTIQTHYSAEKPVTSQSTKLSVKEQLRQIWMNLLDVEQINDDDDFFRLGGHSMLAIKMLFEVDKLFGVKLSIRDLFMNVSLEMQASYIESLMPEPQQQTQPDAEPTEEKQPLEGQLLPTSFAQQRLWFIDSMQGSSEEYNISYAVKYQGHLDLNAANQAISHIIARHASLRTVFVQQDGSVFQQIQPTEKFLIQDIHLASTADEGAIKRTLREHAMARFDLSNDLLVRVAHLKLNEELNQTQGIITFCTHHIVSDAWSMGLFVREFVAEYSAILANQPSPIASLTMQYVDFAVWQREQMATADYQSQLNYWQKHLAGLPAVHDVHLDRPRPDNKSNKGEVIKFELSATTSNKIVAYAKRLGVTPFMIVHGVLAKLISIHSHNHDVVIGAPIVERPLKELSSVIGLFINAMVLRVNTAQNTIQDYFDHVKQVHMDAQANSGIPFEKLVEALNAPRSRAFTPLFQILLNFDITERTSLTLPNLDISPVSLNTNEIKHDLEVNVQFSQNGAVVHWVYDTTLFHDKHMRDMVSGFITLLDNLLTVDCNRAMTQLLAVEQCNLEEAFTESLIQGKPAMMSEPFLTRFATAAQFSPNATAVSYGQDTISYQVLDDRSNQMAQALIDMGFDVGDLAGICLEPSLDMVVSLLAILKAGGAYVPLDHQQSKDRLTKLCHSAGLEWILSTQKFFDIIPMTGMDLIDVEGCAGEHPEYNHYSSDTPNLAVPGDQLAYIIYTSGSTGEPKGVMVERNQLDHYVNHCRQYYEQTNVCGALVATPLIFDATVTSLLVPLAFGKQVALLPTNPEQMFPKMLDVLFGDHDWLIKLTPAHLIGLRLTRELQPDQIRAHHFVLGGEQLTWDILQPWRHYLPNSTFINEYGPTETTVGCTTYAVTPSDVLSRNGAVPIGQPIDGMQILLLDSDKNPIAPGAAGELYIGGTGVTRGYVNMDNVTAERFVELQQGPQGRFYRSGDLARILPDGDLEYLGRIDEQVKIRGYRIELEEVEHHLLSHQGVAAAVVLKVTDIAGDDSLGCWLVPEGTWENEQLLTALRQHLKTKLPSFMQPTVFHILDAIPLTTNGKVDRVQLRAMESTTSDTAPHIEPKTDTEQELAKIWSGQLGQRVGRNDNYFDLGAHSLMVMRLLAEIRRSYGTQLSITTVFENPTLRQLAARIDDQVKLETNQLCSDEQFDTLVKKVGNCVIKLNESRSLHKVFCFHAGAGTAFVYRQIADGCNDIAAFYGFQPPQVHLGLRKTDMYQMCQFYVNLITSIQPEGPYNLMGFSMGGTIAYEVAQQLKAMGKTVAHISQLDNPYNSWSKDDSGKPWYFPIRRAFQGYLDLHLDFDWKQLDQLTETEGMTILQQELVNLGVQIEGVERTAFIPYMQFFCDMYWMYGKYQATPSDFDIDVYVAEQKVEQSKFCNEYLDWDQATSGNLTTTSVGGDHTTMLIEPHLSNLVAKIAKRLQEVL